MKNTSINKIKIAIIIPVYNESKIIEKFSHHIETVFKNAEIIFVDGKSTDDTTQKIAGKYKLLHSKKRSRGYQMNLAAKSSVADYFFFVHADSYFDENAYSEVMKFVSSSKKLACFKIKFDSNNIFMKLIALMSNIRIKLRSIVFGDQGILIERELFFELGQFPDIPIMEDYALSIKLKKKKVKINILNSNIISSDRRFRKNGILKTIFKMQKLQRMYRKSKDINKILKLYDE